LYNYIKETFMSSTTKAMLNSWFNAFAAAVISALIFVLGDSSFSVSDLWYVLIAGVVAVLPVIKNYFDSNYSLYGKGSTEG
jgi:hypothetical protein